VFIGAGSFTGIGNDLSNNLYGGTGSDALSGMGGNDLIFGQGGSDTLSGGAGADYLDGGAGSDSMFGGADNDVYIIDDAADTVTEEAGEGIDAAWSLLSSYTLGANLEYLVFIGAGSFTGIGNDLSNNLYGGTGSDALSGMGGNDLIFGQGGSDTLS
ncbi:MAG: calcium-binding protein, partial [Phycisphaerae bacterium]